MVSFELVLAMLLAVIVSGYLVRIIPIALTLPIALAGSSRGAAPRRAAAVGVLPVAPAAAAVPGWLAQHEIQQQTPPAEAEICADAARWVIANYQRRVSEAESGVEADHLRQADAMEHRFTFCLPSCERAAVLDLAATDASDETARRLLRELDLRETLYR